MITHWSDCTLHSEPAYRAGPCNRGGLELADDEMTLNDHAATEARVASAAGDPRPPAGSQRDGWDAAQADLCRRHMAPPSLTPEREREILLERAIVWERMYEEGQ